MTRPPDTTIEAYADANLFIALLAGPHHPSHAAAVSILARMDRTELRLVVTPVVVAEVVWAARLALGRSRSEIAAILLELVESDGLVVVERAVIRRALELQAADAALDFADAYLGARALELGPPEVASFDRDIDRIAGVRRIDA